MIDAFPAIIVVGFPLNVSDVGKHTIFYRAKDASGNQGGSITRVVQVLDKAVEKHAQEVAYGVYKSSLEFTNGNVTQAESDAYDAYVAAGGERLRSNFDPTLQEATSGSESSASAPIIIIIVVIVGAVLFLLITVILIMQKRRHDHQIRKDEAMYAKVAEALGPEAVRQWNENFAGKNKKKLASAPNGIYGLTGVHTATSSSDGPVYDQVLEVDEEFARIVATLKSGTPQFGLNGKAQSPNSRATALTPRFHAHIGQSETVQSMSDLGQDDADGYMAPTATLKPGFKLQLDASGYVAPGSTLQHGATLQHGLQLDQDDYVVPTATLKPRKGSLTLAPVTESNDDDEFAPGNYVDPFGRNDYAEPEEPVGYEVSTLLMPPLSAAAHLL